MMQDTNQHFANIGMKMPSTPNVGRVVSQNVFSMAKLDARCSFVKKVMLKDSDRILIHGTLSK